MSTLFMLLLLLGEPQKQIFGKSWEFVPTGNVGIPKKEKNVYFAFPAVLSIFFFMKKSHFLVIGDFSSQLLPKICFCGSPYGQCHNQHTRNIALISSSLYFVHHQCEELLPIEAPTAIAVKLADH